MNLVTADQMRSIEQHVDRLGLSLSALMQLAGYQTAAWIESEAPRGPCLLLIGPGNNGGDGIVAARRLAEHGKHVTLYCLTDRQVHIDGAEVIVAVDDPDHSLLRDRVAHATVIVDALLGIGQRRGLDRTLTDIVQAANNRPASSLGVAVDVPTGVDADTGEVPGVAFNAATTLCMGFIKPGLVVYPGADHAGRVHLEPLFLEPALAANSPLSYPDDTDIAPMLPKRGANSNKGTFGRVVVAGGSVNYQGAPALASLAAYRSGAGLVEVLVPDAVQPGVATHVLECVFAPGSRPGPDLNAGAIDQLMTACEKADALAFGSGLSQSDDTLALTRAVLERRKASSRMPALFDADGLNNLSKTDTWWTGQHNLVLTPHPGEMARLTGMSVSQVQACRIDTAREHARRWGQVVVLKGAGTIVAAPDGRISVNRTGGANLATAGTGDVLSGTIAGLLAQGCPPWDAAVAGVYLHGMAGDIIRERLGDSGTLAGDLTGALPLAHRQIVEGAAEKP